MPKFRPLQQRFWEKVDKKGINECWNWTGSVDKHGYGHIMARKSTNELVKAHRLSWMLKNLRVPEKGKWICHTCDNPRCVNPYHLYEGNRKTNNEDRVLHDPNSPRRNAKVINEVLRCAKIE